MYNIDDIILFFWTIKSDEVINNLWVTSIISYNRNRFDFVITPSYPNNLSTINLKM